MLSILALIFVFIAGYFAYKSAKESGRNPVLWCVITILVGFGLQIIFPFLIGVVMMLVLVYTGNPIQDAQLEIMRWAFAITIFTLLSSVVGVMMTLKYAASMPKEVEANNQPLPPPPPNNF